jgi:MFS superfamily sulfate permease-like transporter
MMLKVCSGWELETERGPDWLIVRIKEPTKDVVASCSLLDVLWSLLEQHCTHRLVLELDQMGHLDDPLLEELIQLHDRIAEHGGVMRLCGLSAENRCVLLSRPLDGGFVAYLDRDDAVSGGGLPRHPR